MHKVTLPPMPMQQAEAIRKIAQKHGAAVTYHINGNGKHVVVEIEPKAKEVK